MQISKNIKLKIEPVNKNNVNYVFLNDDGTTHRVFPKKALPSTLSTRTDVIKYIIKNKGWEDTFLPKIIDDKVNDELIPELNQLYEETLEKQEQSNEKELRNELQTKLERIQNGKELYETINNPFLYIKEICDWISAGETRNILFALDVYISHLALKSGINVIPIGDASQGKDHIRSSAFEFLPQDKIVMEKSVTPAVIFRRAEEDIHFYDGKIVFYGDLGGTKDKEYLESSINLMKELQTEHYLNKPTNFNDEGGWYVKDLELEGTPAITFTTVPNALIDTQILSRGVTLSPRDDNNREFFAMKAILNLKGVAYDYLNDTIKPAIDDVRDMIEYICSVSEDLVLINPYYEALQHLLMSSDFYKRDYDKYQNLLYAVALINNLGNIIEYDGKKYLGVTANDVRIFSELISDYRSVISNNLSKGALTCLNSFISLKDNLSFDELETFYDSGEDFALTRDEFIKKANLKYAKNSVRTYFRELVENGFVEVCDERKGQKNIYKLTSKSNNVKGIDYILEVCDWENLDVNKKIKEQLQLQDFLVEDNGLFNKNYHYFAKPPWKDEKKVDKYNIGGVL